MSSSESLIIIIKRISRAPIYHTRWQHRALYSNTNHTHTHTHTHTMGKKMIPPLLPGLEPQTNPVLNQ